MIITSDPSNFARGRIAVLSPHAAANRLSDLDPTRVRPPNGISIGSAVFAQLALMYPIHKDRHTHRPCYVRHTAAIGRIFACVQAMRLNNNNKFVRLRGRPYIHTCRSNAWPVRTPRRPRHGCPARILYWMPMNRRAKFDTASFIILGDC